MAIVGKILLPPSSCNCNIFSHATVLELQVEGGRRRVGEQRQQARAATEDISEKLLNVSLKVVLEESRDAILGTIYTSDKLQAALRAFSTAQIRTLPDDRQIELLSQIVLQGWRTKLHDLIKKYDLISAHTTLGYQIDENAEGKIWSSANPGEGIAWHYSSALLQSFLLVTTIGSGARASTALGRTVAVFYAALGIVIYAGVILMWSRRVVSTFLLLHKAVATKRGAEVNCSKPRILQDEAPAPPSLLILSSLLASGYLCGLGPLAIQPMSSSYDERLEAAFFCLTCVRIPSVLPEGAEATAVFIAYILVGHVIVVALLKITKLVAWTRLERSIGIA